MLDPNIGLLIHGLREELKNSVLPELGSGSALRQLKAGIHLLGRLEKTWDLSARYLLEDNNDIETCFKEFLDLCTDFDFLNIPENEDFTSTVVGVNDPNLTIQINKNRYLHDCLTRIQDYDLEKRLNAESSVKFYKKLNALYRRMSKRDSDFVGG